MACSTPWVERAMEGFARCFEGLKDPRTGNAGRHDLLEILMIALCTVLCGGQTAVDMAEFAEDKEAFLRGFLTLKHGLPSHDTFSRVFRLLDPAPFRACFQSFMARFAELTQGVIAIDGKVLRRSFDTASGTSPLHMVSAWGCDQRLVLAQIATETNEITAVPKLLDMLSLKGTIVTVDALNCQRAIAGQIRAATMFWLSRATRGRCMPMSRYSWMTRPSCPRVAIPRSMGTMAGLKPALTPSQPTSLGCRNSISGLASPPSARSPAPVKRQPRSPPRRPITCSARHCRRNDSGTRRGPIGQSKTTCIGSWT